jgi:hypothetical protein
MRWRFVLDEDGNTKTENGVPMVRPTAAPARDTARGAVHACAPYCAPVSRRRSRCCRAVLGVAAREQRSNRGVVQWHAPPVHRQARVRAAEAGHFNGAHVCVQATGMCVCARVYECVSVCECACVCACVRVCSHAMGNVVCVCAFFERGCLVLPFLRAFP